MGEIKRIILEAGEDQLSQLRAARGAMQDGIQEGGIWGMTDHTGRAFAVKRNKGSVRVYPQKRDDE